MRPIKFIIAGLLADLPGSTKGLVKLTQARATLAELNARFGEFSWPLTLPPTRTNAKIFGVDALHVLGLDKFRSIDYPAELRCDGEIFAGTFRLSAVKMGYVGNFIGAGASWTTDIGDKKLTDLKLAPVAYDGSQLEAILAKTCDETDIQFPLLSFGNFFFPAQPVAQPDGTTEDESLPAQALLSWPLSVDDYLPSIYLRNVLRQILADIGWTLLGRILDEPQWREVLITPAGSSSENAWPWGAILPSSASSSALVSGFIYYNDPVYEYQSTAVGYDEQGAPTSSDINNEGGQVFYLPVPLTTPAPGNPTNKLEGGKSRYTARVAGTYTFDWAAVLSGGMQNLTISTALPVVAQNLFLRVGLGLCVLRGGNFDGADGGFITGTGPVDATVLPSYVRIDVPGPSFQFGNYGATGIRIFLEAGDVVQLATFARRIIGDSAHARRNAFRVEFSSASLACTAWEDVDGNTRDALYPAAFLPSMGQRDLLRDFMLRANLVGIPDIGRRTLTLLTRDELRTSMGGPVDLSELIDPDALEYSPAAGAGVGAVVFRSAENTSEPLPAGLLDTVRATIGPGTNEQRIESRFAPVAFRTYRLARFFKPVVRISLPTLSTTDALAQPLASVSWDVGSQPPRLLRYTGPDPTVTVAFQSRLVPLGRAAWDGALRFDGTDGAVASYYPRTVEQLTRGHLAKVPINLTPAQYRQLRPGRGVTIQGATYAVESLSQFDMADEASTATIELIREL